MAVHLLHYREDSPKLHEEAFGAADAAADGDLDSGMGAVDLERACGY
jgi:hypothetical protein